MAEPVRSFTIKHYGGLCVSLDQSNGRLRLTAACTEKFSLTSSKNLRHMATGKCVVPTSLGNNARITLTTNCSNEWTQFEQTSGFSMKHVISRKCIHPLNGFANPGINTEIVLLTGCDQDRSQFKFMWGNPFYISFDTKLAHIYFQNLWSLGQIQMRTNFRHTPHLKKFLVGTKLFSKFGACLRLLFEDPLVPFKKHPT